MGDTRNRSTTVSLAVLGLLVMVLISLAVWKLRPPEDIPAPKLDFKLNRLGRDDSRAVQGSANTVVERLTGC